VTSILQCRAVTYSGVILTGAGELKDLPESSLPVSPRLMYGAGCDLDVKIHGLEESPCCWYGY